MVFIAANFIEDTVMSIIILIIAAAFFVIARFTPEALNRLFFRIIGLTGLIFVALDLFADSTGENLIRSDVALLSRQSGIPEFAWIALWLLIFLVLFWYMGKKNYFQQKLIYLSRTAPRNNRPTTKNIPILKMAYF
ncbi:M50 family metallopeptidase [Melioribacter roseus]|uniref:M50 family metallopeptidase n=1 Tax=Melioribacter roseus TaxID=1134405 RepID=UPI00059D8C0D|nr:M50 family metallopeptidase [Melioribacter roseus]